MRRTFVHVFKAYFYGNFVLFLCQCLEKLRKKYAIIGIDIDIDIRESIDKYRYFSHH